MRPVEKINIYFPLAQINAVLPMTNSAKLALFRRINEDPKVQSFMDEMATRISDLIVCMSFFDAVYKENKKNDYVFTNHSFDIPEPWEYLKNEEKTLHLKTTANHKDSGAVLPAEIKEVFRKGNVRERCYQILTILCREKKYNILKWVIFTQNESMPSFLNKNVIKHFRHIVNGFGRETGADQKISMLRRRLFVVSEKRQRLRRPVEQAQMEEYKICEKTVIPPLSTRELKVVGAYREHETDVLPWVTGRQQWMLSEATKSSLTKYNPGHELISGLSGHTECFLVFLRMFRCFDIRKMTLACVLWLVPCEHHSLYEVLHTAKIHGLKYNLSQNPISFCHELLDRI